MGTFNIIVWQDGYFQVDTQIGLIGLSDTPVIEGYSDWLN